MEQILDEIKESKNEKRTFSILSILALVANTAIIIYLILRTSRKIQAAESLQMIPPIQFLYAFIIFYLFGIVFTCLSFYKKETSSILKWLAAILNILFTIFYIGVYFMLQNISSG